MTRKQVVYKSVGEYLREAAVLVSVFGIFDHIVRNESMSWGGIGAVINTSMVLFWIGLEFTIGAET